MNVFEGIDGLRKVPPGSVMSIGNFDGLHRGHARIIQTMKSLRDESRGQRMAVVTFEPHPLTILRPELAPPRLTPSAVKWNLLQEAGVNDYVILPPTRDVLGMAAAEFWRILKDQVRVSHLVEGPSFNFGKDRRGNIQRLLEWSAGTSVQLHVVQPVIVPLLDLQLAPVSSSLIRWLLAHGRVRDAAICLGRPYVLEGTVVKGFERGRTIGIPTVNLDCGDQHIPADGVYVGRCDIDGIVHTAAVSIGNAPTFQDAKWQIEAHLLDFSGDLYGRTIQIEMVDWVRDQRRFRGGEELKKQIERDIADCRARGDLDPSHMVASIA